MEDDEITKVDHVFPRPPGEYRRRLEADHKGFLAESNGKLVGVYWINMGNEHVEREKFCRFRLPPDTAWAYDAAVLPAWQLSGVFAHLLFHSLEYVRKHERTRICGYASWFNKESLRAHYSFGHEPLLSVCVINVLGLRLYRTSRPQSSEVKVRAGTMATIDLAP